MIKSLAYIQDANPEKLAHASEWLVEHALWKKRREDVVKLLINHRQHGAQVYIASSVVEPFIEPFAKRIGVLAIGTPVEIVNRRVRLVGDLVTNEKKCEQVLRRLGVQHVDVAYGDTVLDIPMLEKADHPVAVYPDEKLMAVALERSWEIIGNNNY